MTSSDKYEDEQIENLILYWFLPYNRRLGHFCLNTHDVAFTASLFFQSVFGTVYMIYPTMKQNSIALEPQNRRKIGPKNVKNPIQNIMCFYIAL